MPPNQKAMENRLREALGRFGTVQEGNETSGYRREYLSLSVSSPLVREEVRRMLRREFPSLCWSTGALIEGGRIHPVIRVYHKWGIYEKQEGNKSLPAVIDS